MSITASMIKELRERTGIGMTKCKKALENASGDINLAIENLRKEGAASAVKKEGRETKEGLISVAQNDDAVAIVEINSETDFVVKNERFGEFLEKVTAAALSNKPSSLEEFFQQTMDGQTVEEARAAMVQTIGENIQISRVKVFLKGSDRSLGVYKHLGGKLVVVVELSGAAEEGLAKDIAMHSAAAAPEYVRPEEIPSELVEKEKEIARHQMEGKKPENILEKIIEGKLNSYYQRVCLLKQSFIRDENLTISQLLAKRSKESGKELSVEGFTRWGVGRG